MYNYSFRISYFDLPEEQQDDQYRKDFLKAFQLTNYESDVILKTIDDIYEKVKDDSQMKAILQNYEKNVYRYPIEIDHGGIFTFLFSFESFQYLHECLGYLLENKKIDDECFNKFIFSFKNNSK